MRIILPIGPKPQSHLRFARRGNYIQICEDGTMRAYEQEVKMYLRKVRPKLIERGPIMTHVTFYVQALKPALSNKQKRLDMRSECKYCDKRPDSDNYFKVVADAAEGILYKNDGQTTVMVCQELYSMRQWTEIETMSLEEGE